MKHLVLLGDSIFDNASYTAGGPDVITHLKRLLPPDWRSSLRAIDGATTLLVPAQLIALPADVTHLVLSVGGNNALKRADILETAVKSSGEALLLLAQVAREFEKAYLAAVNLCLSRKLPLVICTIYNGNFEDEKFQQVATTALAVFNDVIIRVAIQKQLPVIDLRFVCRSAEDYSNPIEPSVVGGEKIARAIVKVITGEPLHAGPGARITA